MNEDVPFGRIKGADIAEDARMAVRNALWSHKQLGHPIAVWRDGQVVWIAPEDIPADGPVRLPVPEP